MAITPTSDTIRDFPSVTVAAKLNWSDAWTDIDYLRADALEISAAPSISTATLSYQYGEIAREGRPGFATYARLSLLGKWVRVTWTPDEGGDALTWVGGVIDAQDDRLGNGLGNQSFSCVGAEWLLTRIQIDRSWHFQIHGLPPEQEIEIGRAIPFNGGAGDGDEVVAGNKSVINAGPDGTYLFAKEFDDVTTTWSNADIVRYLLARFTPQNAAGDAEPKFILPSDTAPIDWYEPRVVECEGRSCWDVLNQVIDRRRGVGFVVEPTSGGNEFQLRLFTTEKTAIPLPGGKEIPANANQTSIDFDAAIDIERASVIEEINSRYSQVRVRGAKRRTCFSVSFADSTLEADWDSAEETAYEDGASGETGYSALDISEQEAHNDAVRSSPELARVFTHFRLPAPAVGDNGWDLKAGDGIGGTKNFVMPLIKPDGNLDTATTVRLWLAGAKLAEKLPLLTGVDYEPAAPLDRANLPDGFVKQPRDPFLAIQVGTASPLFSNDTYLLGDQLMRVAGNEDGGFFSEGKPVRSAIGVTMYERGLGIIVEPDAMPHILAATDYDDSEPSSIDGDQQFDYADDGLIATVAIEWDERVEFRWPQNPQAGGDNPPAAHQILTIDLGDRARHDYLAPGTVVDLDGFDLVHATGGEIRNDRTLLEETAKAAWAWYETPRASLDLAYKQLSGLFGVGHLITELAGGEQINTAITSVRWNLAAGTTAIRTGYQELDFGNL